jgi:hypothetical protein
VLLLALTALHALHDSDHMATDMGDVCLGLVVVFGFLVVIRLAWRVQVTFVQERLGRAPPRDPLLRPPQAATGPALVPLRL